MNFKNINKNIAKYLSASTNGFSPIQKANYNHSLSWKKQSKQLLSTKDLSDFKKAIRWCGVAGNVARTVKKERQEEFAKILFSHLDEINNGTFMSWNNLDIGKPVSWISKICHIINPHMYPIIYDIEIRNKLGIRNLDEYFHFIEVLRSRVKSIKADDIYKLDSIIWAE